MCSSDLVPRQLGSTRQSDACIATYPGDMAVAMRVLDAMVETVKADGSTRAIPIADFHRLWGDTPHIETVLEPGELITGVELPPPSDAVTQSEYRKVRDRSSYAFALISVAGGLALSDGRIAEARIALGGVAAKPWRASRAETALVGVAPTPDAFQAAIREELIGAQPLSGNGFKIGLVERTVVAVLTALAGEHA